MKILILALTLALSINYVACVLGVDVSSLLSVDTWKCIHNSGYTFAIPRGWCSYGGMDANVK